MAAERDEEMEAEAAEEQQKHGKPFDAVPHGAQEGLVADAVAEEGVGDWGEAVENYGHAAPHAPRIEVEMLAGVVLVSDLVGYLGERGGEGDLHQHCPRTSRP
jgi:hypothetical protein